MENASKALVIAGAILLVIAIIAIAVGIVSKTRGTMDTAGNQIDTMAVQMHNSSFQCSEQVTGEEVKEYIAKALANNNTNKNKEFFVRIIVRDGNVTPPVVQRFGKYYNFTGNDFRNFSSEFSIDDAEKIDNSSLYSSTIYYNSYGIIYGINFIKI